MSLEQQEIKNVIEAALLAYGKPLSLDAIANLFEGEEDIDKKVIRDAIASIEEDCASRGVELKKVSSGYRFQAKQDYSKWLQSLWEEKPPRYSRALLETLVLIAYKQPITRGEIEDVRGVSVSSHIIKTLQERDWVRVVGHRDVPGKPALFATTKGFLDYFNLSSLDELPSLAQIKDLDRINDDLLLGAGQPAAEAQAGSEPETGSDAHAASGYQANPAELEVINAFLAEENNAVVNAGAGEDVSEKATEDESEEVSVAAVADEQSVTVQEQPEDESDSMSLTTDMSDGVTPQDEPALTESDSENGDAVAWDDEQQDGRLDASEDMQALSDALGDDTDALAQMDTDQWQDVEPDDAASESDKERDDDNAGLNTLAGQHKQAGYASSASAYEPGIEGFDNIEGIESPSMGAVSENPDSDKSLMTSAVSPVEESG